MHSTGRFFTGTLSFALMGLIPNYVLGQQSQSPSLQGLAQTCYQALPPEIPLLQYRVGGIELGIVDPPRGYRILFSILKQDNRNSTIQQENIAFATAPLFEGTHLWQSAGVVSRDALLHRSSFDTIIPDFNDMDIRVQIAPVLIAKQNGRTSRKAQRRSGSAEANDTGFQGYCLKQQLQYNWETDSERINEFWFGTTETSPVYAAVRFKRKKPLIQESELFDATRAVASPGPIADVGAGLSVAVSADGETAIVGSPCKNSPVSCTNEARVAGGAAWIFTHGGEKWELQKELIVSDAKGAAAQGVSVALSANGNTAIVGVPCAGSEDCAAGSATGAARVFIHEKVKVSEGVKFEWSKQEDLVVAAAPRAFQGKSVALSANGSTAIVGAPCANPSANTNCATGHATGAAWVFTRGNSGMWDKDHPVQLVAKDGNDYAAFQGNSVALSADGKTAVVGGAGYNSHEVAAWAFDIDSPSNPVKLGGASTTDFAQPLGYTGRGETVALSADGKTAIVGRPSDNSSTGSAWAWVYGPDKNSKTTPPPPQWSSMPQMLVGTGNVGPAQQGGAVAVSANGHNVLIGGSADHSGTGAAWLFTFQGTTWYQQQKVVDRGARDLGKSVALSADGTIAIVGGRNVTSNTGAAWVFGPSKAVPLATTK
jgi:hypothetical protein